MTNKIQTDNIRYKGETTIYLKFKNVYICHKVPRALSIFIISIEAKSSDVINRFRWKF